MTRRFDAGSRNRGAFPANCAPGCRAGTISGFLDRGAFPKSACGCSAGANSGKTTLLYLAVPNHPFCGSLRIVFLAAVRARFLDFEIVCGFPESVCGSIVGAISGNLTFQCPARSWLGRIVGGMRECVCGCSADANSGNNGLRDPAIDQSLLLWSPTHFWPGGSIPEPSDPKAIALARCPEPAIRKPLYKGDEPQ